MRPRCSVLTGGFESCFEASGCGDFTSCPPVERGEMSNSEPSAIVLQGMPCIGGLYISFDSIRMEKTVRSRFAATLSSVCFPRLDHKPEKVFSPVKIPPAAGSRGSLGEIYGTSGTRALPVRAGLQSFSEKKFSPVTEVSPDVHRAVISR